MLVFTARRFASMFLIMLVVSLILFALFEGDKKNVARKVLGPYAIDEQLTLWVEQNGYNQPFFTRYASWIGKTVRGDFGESLQYRRPVNELLWPRLANTGILAAAVLFLMVPLSLGLGILAGAREGSLRDRVISVISIITTSVPEFASATFLSMLLVFHWKILPGTSSFMLGFNFHEMILPVSVLVLYDFGYVARITRASMAEVMTSNYIRTAILKGLPYSKVVMTHALRNALIAPFTVIVLQLNWLLSGVIVTEVFFAYKGFGKLLLDAALFGDIFVIQACTLVAVAIAVISQFISDIGYLFLNPRIRFSLISRQNLIWLP